MPFSSHLPVLKKDCFLVQGFPAGSDDKESACSAGDMDGFDSWVGKIPWRRAWQPMPAFLPGEFSWIEEPGGLQSMEPQRVRHNSVTKQQQHYCSVLCMALHVSSTLPHWMCTQRFVGATWHPPAADWSGCGTWAEPWLPSLLFMKGSSQQHSGSV